MENRRHMTNVRKLYEKITRDRWEIGFVEGGIDAVMGPDPMRVNWLRHDYHDRWFADPFILDVTETEILVLVEEYRYKTRKGRITLLTVNRSTYELKSMRIVLEEDTHLSFPAICRSDGRVFVYPESWQSGSLSCYEFKDGVCDLSSRKTICEEAMADAIMTSRFGKKQLFSVCENDRLRIYDYDDVKERYVLSYEKPFGKATARNAGDFFEYKGKVYRPAQVCVERYGEAVEIQQVLWDEKENFCFVPYKTLYSSHSSLDSGMHTLNFFKGMAVIDVHGWNNALTVKCIMALKKSFLGDQWKRKTRR